MMEGRDVNLVPMYTAVKRATATQLRFTMHSQATHNTVDNKIRIFFICSQKRNYYNASAYNYQRYCHKQT